MHWCHHLRYCWRTGFVSYSCLEVSVSLKLRTAQDSTAKVWEVMFSEGKRQRKIRADAKRENELKGGKQILALGSEKWMHVAYW